jgi:hypothetical protein
LKEHYQNQFIINVKFLDSKTQIVSYIIDDKFCLTDEYLEINCKDPLLKSDISLSYQMLNQLNDKPYETFKQIKEIKETDPSFMEFSIKRDTVGGYEIENINKFLNFICQSMCRESVEILLKFIQNTIDSNNSGKIAIVDKNSKFGKNRKHFNLFSINVEKEIVKIEINFTYLGFTLVHSNEGAVYKIISSNLSDEFLITTRILSKKLKEDEEQLTLSNLFKFIDNIRTITTKGDNNNIDNK